MAVNKLTEILSLLTAIMLSLGLEIIATTKATPIFTLLYRVGLAAATLPTFFRLFTTSSLRLLLRPIGISFAFGHS